MKKESNNRMEHKEIELREKLNNYGYKLKQLAERGYFVKSRYTNKVISPLNEKRQPVYMSLDDVESWLNEIISEEKRQKKLWEDKLDKYRKVIVYPQYDEWCINIVIEKIKNFSRNNSQWIINNNHIVLDIFNPQSELYDEFIKFTFETILDKLSDLSKYNFPLTEEIAIDFSEKYYDKYLELNMEIEKESDEGIDILQDLISDGEISESEVGLLERVYSEISIDELKKLIFGVEE